MPAGITDAVRSAGFHPQRLQSGLDLSATTPELDIEDWDEFCATARALGVSVLFYEAEPFSETDFPVFGPGARPVWDLLPGAAWLRTHLGEIPTVIYFAFFAGGALRFQQDTEWWNNTGGLLEEAEEISRQTRHQQHEAALEAFITEVQRTLPHDEAFKKIALLPRPPITEMRRRVTELYPDGNRLVAFLNVTLHDLARQIRAEQRQSRTQTRSDTPKRSPEP